MSGSLRVHAMLRRTLALSVCALALLTARPAAATLIYFNDFEGAAGPGWSNSTITTHQSRKFLGPFANQTVTLTLSGLPAHSHLALSFDLYIFGSWDGNSPDLFKVDIAGATLLNTSFANSTSSSLYQSYPDPYPANNPKLTGAVESNVLTGRINGVNINGESLYHLSFDFVHTASSIVVNYSSQVSAPGDERFGLDNVSVENPPTPVPEPGSLLLLGSGLAGLAFFGRKRLSPDRKR